LELKRTKLLKYLNTIPDSLLIIEPISGDIVFMNNNFMRDFGYLTKDNLKIYDIINDLDNLVVEIKDENIVTIKDNNNTEEEIELENENNNENNDLTENKIKENNNMIDEIKDENTNENDILIKGENNNDSNEKIKKLNKFKSKKLINNKDRNSNLFSENILFNNIISETNTETNFNNIDDIDIILNDNNNNNKDNNEDEEEEEDKKLIKKEKIIIKHFEKKYEISLINLSEGINGLSLK
jgi:hypothetical protein